MLNNDNWKIKEVRDEFDGDKLDFILYDGGCLCELGRVEIEVLYESYEYEFSSILTELEFAKEFSNEPIVKVARVEVPPVHRKKGVATYLLTEVFKRLRLAGFNQWFLNASPLDEDGPKLEDLENFYSKFGFHKEQLREESTLMWFKDEI